MALKVLLLDNFDSFTWNLQHYLEAEGADVLVIRNNLALPDINQFAGIVLSPGPGMPSESGQLMAVTNDAIERSIPLLGVCLGMQAIALHFGGTLTKLENPIHGRATECCINDHNDLLLQNVPSKFNVGRYHSWIVETPLPYPLLQSSTTKEQIAMSCFHPEKPINAVQFHPESILTPEGRKMIHNWLSRRVNGCKKILNSANLG